jgi:hypothetical protein
VAVCTSFVNRLGSTLDAHPQSTELRLDDLLKMVEDARWAEYQSGLDWANEREQLGITLEQWRQSASANLEYRRGQK